ncbi:MAG: sugar ABC transporter ATP-binding protein [Leptolyngbyaceae cyanobacterium RU_5_1]|nr:sugar ABC transporter ATP-binding protein [Leptolyngbyaceae cyanobacterium RU_5_1]
MNFDASDDYLVHRDRAELSQPSASDAAPVLQATGICRRFGFTQALQNASLTLQAGEVHILLGENGAGKSTLAKIMAGVYRPDAGTLSVNGQPVIISSVKMARQLGIATVFQELSLATHLSVVDNLFLGCEAGRHSFTWLNRSRERTLARQVLEELDIDIPLHLPVTALAIAEKQMLEIAKALLRQPRILIMDEPTSTLTEREKTRLFKIVQTLQSKGVGILYVTHHLPEVFELGTRVSAMLDGSIHHTIAVTDTLTEATLLEMLTGRRISIDMTRPAQPNTQPIFVVEDLHAPGCAGVNLHITSGEIVGIYGVVGCGRESLGRAIAGLIQPTRGTMTLLGQDYAPRHPQQAQSRGVGYMPMDRKEAGILAERSVQENLNLSNLNAFTRLGLLSDRQERTATIQQLNRLRVRYSAPDAPITRLSGGNQQKVLFGRAIVRAPRLLVMEDPTAGIDMGAKLELHRQMQELAERGTSILLLSSDLPETLMLCNRVYSIYAGKIVDELMNPNLQDEERILAAVLGRQTNV